jgi:peptide methionine sulfoxide reductase MsrA
MGSKTLSLRDNRLKSFISNKSNRMEFIDKTYKPKKYNLQKLFLRFWSIISQTKRFLPHMY